MREPARKNMYKGVSAAYSVIILSYWQLASCGYWAFGSEVQPYILSSLSVPEWTIVMANLFAVIQISGCYQIYCRPTYAYFEEKNAVQQSYWPFPPEKIPCPTYFHFHLHGSYYSYCCGCAVFWGLCVHLWRNWVHSTGFCLPFCGIFQSGKNAQGHQMSPFNAAP